MKKNFFFSIKHELLTVHRQEILQNTKNNYCKEKAAKYYLKNKEELKKSQKIGRKIYQKKEKINLKNIKIRNISNWYSVKMNYHWSSKKTDQINFILLSIEMNLKLGEIKIDKKEFHKSKKPVDFNLVDTNEIVASDKF